jgi:hypothetical protein
MVWGPYQVGVRKERKARMARMARTAQVSKLFEKVWFHY